MPAWLRPFAEADHAAFPAAELRLLPGRRPGLARRGLLREHVYETPNIDRLARQGMRFTDAYAAWNRLVEVLASDGSTVIAQYQYDGRDFRTVKKTYTSGSLSETRDFYYNGNWQCLEERLESGSVISSYANRQYVSGPALHRRPHPA